MEKKEQKDKGPGMPIIGIEQLGCYLVNESLMRV